jgi:hypothetical protein
LAKNAFGALSALRASAITRIPLHPGSQCSTGTVGSCISSWTNI